jgi:hypothetical protein
MTRDEFCQLVLTFHYGQDLVDKVTDELIVEGMRWCGPHAARLEAVARVPPEEWQSISLPRFDGKGNIRPRLVRYAVKDAFRMLCAHMRRAARSSRFQPRSHGLSCPYCGGRLEIELRMGGSSDG